MNQILNCKFLRLKNHPNATFPQKNFETDSCFDFFSDVNLVLPIGETKMVGTGISVRFGKNVKGQLKSRSGLAKNQITVQGGEIDETYDGEIFVLLHNSSKNDFEIRQGSKIAQFELQWRPEVEIHYYDEETEEKIELNYFREIGKRGENGFGSSTLKSEEILRTSNT